MLSHPCIQPLQASWELDTPSWGLPRHSVSSHEVPTLSSFLSLCLICLSRLPRASPTLLKSFSIRRLVPSVSSCSQQAMTSKPRQPLEGEFFSSLPTFLQMGQMDGWMGGHVRGVLKPPSRPLKRYIADFQKDSWPRHLPTGLSAPTLP